MQGSYWDKISRMIKQYGKTKAIPLKLIFRSMQEEGVFPHDWKKTMKFQFAKGTPLSVSLASFQAIHVLLHSCQLRMKSTKVLIVIRHTM